MRVVRVLKRFITSRGSLVRQNINILCCIFIETSESQEWAFWEVSFHLGDIFTRNTTCTDAAKSDEEIQNQRLDRVRNSVCSQWFLITSNCFYASEYRSAFCIMTFLTQVGYHEKANSMTRRTASDQFLAFLYVKHSCVDSIVVRRCCEWYLNVFTTSQLIIL